MHRDQEADHKIKRCLMLFVQSCSLLVAKCIATKNKGISTSN